MKRSFADTSPASSTPPLPPAKRRRDFDSDAASSECSYTYHAPSDSPTNPFGRYKPRLPRTLPHATPTDSHLLLRFQLATQPHNVYRVAAVPADYTFWHLSRLCQFLFGWKDMRTERDPYNKMMKIERKVEHVFTVQKEVVMFLQASKAGVIKSGRTVMRIMGDVKGLKPDNDEEVRWEREESYILQNLWRRGNETTRAVHYDRDVFGRNKDIVHITLLSGTALNSYKKSQFDGLSNTPLVLQGAGLPDDEEDDELQLDLLQWNEDEAFENFIHKLDEESGKKYEDEDDEEDPEEFQRRLAEERALVRRRMSAPLPKKLPIDDELEPEVAAAATEEKPKPKAVAPLLVAKKKGPAPITQDVEPEGGAVPVHAVAPRQRAKIMRKVPPRRAPQRAANDTSKIEEEV